MAPPLARVFVRRGIGLALAMVWIGAARGGTLASPGCLDGGKPVTVMAVGEALDLVLADGRDVLLPGIDLVRNTPTRPAAAAAARHALEAWLVGRSIRLLPVRTEPDRWGRTVALAFAPDPAPDPGAARDISVIEAMLDAGLARARPDRTVSVCWPAYLALEASARAGRLGVWSDPAYAVIPATDKAALAAHTGAMAVVEGRTTILRSGRSRTYLPMDARGGSGFAITVERRTALGLAKAGADPAAWVGKHLRVRGFLDDRFGLQIEVSLPEQVEVLDP